MSSTSPRPGGTRAPGTTPHAGARARLGYNGQLHEPRSCWQILGNGYRVYNPVLRRFHSPDRLSPFGEGGNNAYAYCAGDPVNNVDPTGEFLMPLAVLMGIGAVGAAVMAVVSDEEGEAGNAFLFGVASAVLGLAAGGVGMAAKMPGLKHGKFRIQRGRSRDLIDVHSSPLGANVDGQTLGGREMAKLAKDHGLGSKPITMAACGFARHGQAMANHAGVSITAFPKRVWLWGKSRVWSLSRPMVFHPEITIPRVNTAVRRPEMQRATEYHSTSRWP